MGTARRFVASPHVVAYWERGNLVLFNYAVGTQVVGDSVLASIVHACGKPRTLHELATVRPELSRASFEKLVVLLTQRHILYRAGSTLPDEEVAMRRWSAWNPSAGFFHTASKHVRFDRSIISVGTTSVHEKPARRNSRGGIRLHQGSLKGEFPSVLLARRTWRRFSTAGLELSELAMLLRLTFGVHHHLQLPDGTRAPMRTSPSGGASHPIDAHVACLRVKGTSPGIYEYLPETHRLRRNRRRIAQPSPARYLPGQPWYDDAAALVFFVATFDRTRSQYPYSRAYRAVLIEAGHLCQTFCLAATWMGLAPFCSLALADANIEVDLGIDGVTESVLYAAGVGRRGAAAGKGIAPRGVSGVELTPNLVFTGASRTRRKPQV